MTFVHWQDEKYPPALLTYSSENPGQAEKLEMVLPNRDVLGIFPKTKIRAFQPLYLFQSDSSMASCRIVAQVGVTHQERAANNISDWIKCNSNEDSLCEMSAS